MNAITLNQITLGVDIGTTGCRCVAYNDQAEVVANAERFYQTYSPEPGWAEQDSDLVINEVENCICEAVNAVSKAGYSVSIVSFSAINHGLIPVTDGKPLRHCIIWADNRSTEITEAWRREGMGELFYQRTCCPVHPMYLPGKLVWLARHEPECFHEAERFISLKELLFYRWFGRYVIDASIASSSGLMNSTTCTWDEEILKLIGVIPSQLSEIVPTTAVFTDIKTEARLRLGLPADVQVVIGAGDGVLSSLGAGAIKPGEVTVMIGTSGAARITVDKPTLEPQARTWCYYLTPDAWVVGGAINNAGLTLQWVREHWLNNAPFAEVEKLAAGVAPGANGLKMLPFLTGERSPNWDPNIRAALIGLDLAHRSGHFARAAMEGVAYRIKSVFEPISEMAGEITAIRLGGGFLASPTWVQIVADVLGYPLQILGEPQGSAFGAVLLARLATGNYSSIGEITRQTKLERLISPIPENQVFYRRQYNEYQALYRKLYKNE